MDSGMIFGIIIGIIIVLVFLAMRKGSGGNSSSSNAPTVHRTAQPPAPTGVVDKHAAKAAAVASQEAKSTVSAKHTPESKLHKGIKQAPQPKQKQWSGHEPPRPASTKMGKSAVKDVEPERRSTKAVPDKGEKRSEPKNEKSARMVPPDRKAGKTKQVPDKDDGVDATRRPME